MCRGPSSWAKNKPLWGSRIRIYSTKYYDNYSKLYYYNLRYYNNIIGRWLNRDPLAEKTGLNHYCFVNNNPIKKIDLLGLWGSNVHKDKTTEWAKEYFTNSASIHIGKYDEAVDKGATGPWPDKVLWFKGNQSYHFDRSFGGEDTRLTHFNNHLKEAKKYCTCEYDDPESAVRELGTALHPLQDIVAHGSFAKKNKGNIYVWHNLYSPQWANDSNVPNLPLLEMANLVDDIRYDSTGTYGIPDDRAMRYIVSNGVVVFEWANFERGDKRIKKTKNDTINVLKSYQNFIKNDACCKCKAYFLEVGMIPLDESEMKNVY